MTTKLNTCIERENKSRDYPELRGMSYGYWLASAFAKSKGYSVTFVDNVNIVFEKDEEKGENA